ncbi:hypothetical protein D3C80_1922830 [compost metagenome]
MNVLGRKPAEFVVISFVVSPRMPPPSAMDCATMPCAPAPCVFRVYCRSRLTEPPLELPPPKTVVPTPVAVPEVTMPPPPPIDCAITPMARSP